jgi:hypothetical protein
MEVFIGFCAFGFVEHFIFPRLLLSAESESLYIKNTQKIRPEVFQIEVINTL